MQQPTEYDDMTDEEIKTALQDICRRCEGIITDDEAKNEVKRLTKEELGLCGIGIAITTTSTSYHSFVMRMFMVMAFGPNGNVISI